MVSWIIIPVKSVLTGKSRLASFLTKQQRYSFNRFLLKHTIQVASSINQTRVLVISSCNTTLEIAKYYGANILKEQRPHNLNSALMQATHYVSLKNGESICIIPCDLPYITKIDIAYIIAKNSLNSKMIIAPDQSGQGTSLIYLNQFEKFNFKFDQVNGKSFIPHKMEALQTDREIIILKNHNLSFDIDTPSDYIKLYQKKGVFNEQRFYD